MAITASAQKPVEPPLWPDGAADGMLTIGKTFLGTPYVANVLDKNEDEKLIVNPDEVDCMTLVEYVLVAANFAPSVQNIRYRDGKINGYTSRLHYTSDWINNGIRNGFLEDVTALNSQETMKLAISYMSTHPKSYKQLEGSPAKVARMVTYEKALTGQTVHWLSKEKLPEEGFSWIKEGDIIAITTSIAGLDIAHMGLAIYEKGKLHLLHASSTAGKVVISESPLCRMLDKNKSWTGIRVIRAKKAIP